MDEGYRWVSDFAEFGFSECGNQLLVDKFPRVWTMLLDI